MSDFDTQTRMARLRECFPSVKQLAETLRCDPSTVSRIANGKQSAEKHPDLEDKTRKLHEQIQKEHAAGLDAVSYALQTIERLKAGTITDAHLENVEQVLQQKADELNTAYA